MASRQLFLFATRKDLEPGIRRIEAMLPLKYSLCEMFDSPDVATWKSLLDVDDLGRATRGDVDFAKEYLVLRDDVKLHVRSIPQRRSSQIKYAVDQLANPATITFAPGGLFQSKHVIRGRIGSASDDPESVQLLREFSRTMIRDLAKHDLYYIGPEAKELHLRGGRLITMSIEEKPDYDLVIR